MTLPLFKEAADLNFKFIRDKRFVTRTLKIGSNVYEETVPSSRFDLSPEKDFFVSYLGGKFLNQADIKLPRLNYIDLFCGGGGLSLGVHNAARFLGFNPKLAVAADIDGVCLQLVQKHFNPLITRAKSVEDLVSYEADFTGALHDFVSAPVFTDTQIAQLKGKIDLLVGGPPCQGHSNLNNKTRRSDPRNLLYLVMPAFAVGLKIPNIIIENVRSINKAKENVVEITKNILKTYGYNVEEVILNATDFGVPQNRIRHFLVASINPMLGVDLLTSVFTNEKLTFDDVCNNLEPLKKSGIIEEASNLSVENMDRINFLHENNIFDLPNNERPICHQEDHTYPSVYGRIHGHLPMLTVTTGFSSPGRGRYVHPHEKRVINIREAGRVQGFPDWYWEPAIELGLNRSSFTKIIGDAVPSLMAYPLMVSLFAKTNIHLISKPRATNRISPPVSMVSNG